MTDQSLAPLRFFFVFFLGGWGGLCGGNISLMLHFIGAIFVRVGPK